MTLYAVLTPPKSTTIGAAEQAVFLKDGFVVFGFVFTFAWLALKRAWLAAAIILAIWAAVGFGAAALGVHPAAIAVTQTLLGLFVGLEGQALAERSLVARGWTHRGVVEARDLEAAERRFFEQFTAPAAQPAPDGQALQPIAAPASLSRASDSAVLGLFPDAERRA